MLRFKCPHCEKTFKVKKEHAGRKGKCLGCGKVIRIPQTPAIKSNEEPIAAVLVNEEQQPTVARLPQSPPTTAAPQTPGIPQVESPGKGTPAQAVPMTQRILAGVQEFARKQRRSTETRRVSSRHCPALSVELVVNTTPRRASTLLKEATAKKKSGDWDGAVSLLREAYAQIARGQVTYTPATFLRLPMYLQQAGRPDEAWREFNDMIAGHYPLDLSDPMLAPIWLSEIYGKMRLFLTREKKHDKAVFFGVLSYLSHAKWAAYQAAHFDDPYIRKIRREDFREHADKRTIEKVFAPQLKKAKLEHLMPALTGAISHHIGQGQSLSLGQANADLNAIFSSRHATPEGNA